jgi:hypothetical protein
MEQRPAEKTGRRDRHPGCSIAPHVSSTRRRGYPWQVASPQRLRPFHLAGARCHKSMA